MWRWVWLAAAAELRQQRLVDNGANADGGYPIAGGYTSLERIVSYVKEQAPVDYALCGDDFVKANAERVRQTLVTYPHAKLVPEELLLEYVAPFTVLDEPRGPRGAKKCDRWWQAPRLRDLKHEPEVKAFAKELVPSRDVAAYVATALQGLLGLTFHGDDTPKYMSVNDILGPGNAKHEASCTGMTIVFVNALRSLGVPARAVGTPAWNGKEANGNHNWVEAYVCDKPDGSECEWAFFDALEPLGPPCSNWFCTHAKLGARSGTEVFAARGAKSATAFPLAWAPDAKPGQRTAGDWEHVGGVYGEDRTVAYARLCGVCPDGGSFLQRAAAATSTEIEAAKNRVSTAIADIEQEIASAAAAAAVDMSAGHI